MIDKYERLVLRIEAMENRERRGTPLLTEGISIYDSKNGNYLFSVNNLPELLEHPYIKRRLFDRKVEFYKLSYTTGSCGNKYTIMAEWDNGADFYPLIDAPINFELQEWEKSKIRTV